MPSPSSSSSDSGTAGQASTQASAESRNSDAGTAPASGSSAGAESASAPATQQGSQTAANGSQAIPAGSGDYSLETLPGGTWSNEGSGRTEGNSTEGNSATAGSETASGQQNGGDAENTRVASAAGDGSPAQQNRAGSGGSGPQTADERAAALDDRLNRGYEDFDGFILAERSRAQAERDEAAGSIGGSDSEGSSGGSGGAGPRGGGREGPMILASSRGPASGIPAGSSSAEAPETFPPPEDIPSGDDDDVVARQLREAAMREADPELREKLWEEYRQYTGLTQ